MYERFVKRTLDVLMATVALLLLAPLLAIVAAAIRVDDGGPAIFRQTRSGRAGRPFTIYKFRSMPVASPNVPSAAAGELRVTRVGALIRRTNIDELPQLYNVLIGDMSIIGPRPALPAQVSLLTNRHERGIDLLRPGLTGLAQVNAYDGMPETEKIEWETLYTRRVSPLQDLAIALRTVGYLLRRPPVY